jgi:hypothetical protein
MKRSNSYEAAFEAYLQWHRHCYVAVDETRRSVLGETRVKNLDFIVHGESGARLLVDVKGRRFPGGSRQKPRRVWESWAAQEDVDGLSRWANLFGNGFRGVLVFTYHIMPYVELSEDVEDLWTWRGRRYLLRAVDVDDYREHMRIRSPRWGTVHLPRDAFRQIVRPLHHLTQTPQPHECPF